MAEERDPIDEARRQWLAHGWDDAADGMAAVTTLVRTNQLVTAHIERMLRPFELTFARFEVLRLLAFTRAGSMAMGRLGELLQVHPASVTNAVDRLEAAGLVRRVPNPEDQRSKLAEITPGGRRRVDDATSVLNRFFSEIGPADEIATTRRILNEWSRRAE
jgi:DNA-binding MarR family transcriptional regulator